MLVRADQATHDANVQHTPFACISFDRFCAARSGVAMARRTVPPVAPGTGRAVLNQLSEFRKVEPWRWMPEMAVSAHVDTAGQPWFACVLGNAEQMFGLCLYRGAAGLRFHRMVRERGDGFDPAEYRYVQDAVMVWFGPKSELDREQSKLFQYRRVL